MSSRFEDKDDDGVGAPIDFYNSNLASGPLRPGARPINRPLQPIYAGTDGFYRNPSALAAEPAPVLDSRPKPAPAPVLDSRVYHTRGMETLGTPAQPSLGGYGNLGNPLPPIPGPTDVQTNTPSGAAPAGETSQERRERENPFLKLNKMSPPGPIAPQSRSYYERGRDGAWNLIHPVSPASPIREGRFWPWGNPFVRIPELPAPVTRKKGKLASWFCQRWLLMGLGACVIILIITLSVVFTKRRDRHLVRKVSQCGDDGL